MRVLQVSPRYPPNLGGVEKVVEKLSESLSADGIQVTAFSVDRRPDLPREEKINGVLVNRFIPLQKTPFRIPEPRFIVALSRNKADIIHLHSVHTLLPLFVALFKHKNQKLLIQPHYHRFGQSPFRSSLLKVYRWTLRFVVFSHTSAIIVNSEYEKQAFCEDFPKCRNVILIPEGLDTNELQSHKRDSVVPKRILYVGALQGYKNVDWVLKGFAWLRKNENSDFRLVIVGKGRKRKSLVALAKRLGIDPYIEWKQSLSREQVLSEYAKASVFAFLSRLESFGIVAYEALLMGVPTVVLSSGPLSSMVKAGFAEGVNSLDQKTIARALFAALKKTYPRVTKLHAQNFLDWKDYVHRILNIYKVLLETQRQ